MKLLGMILWFAVLQQQPASIEGIVVKQGSGEPVAGATVQLNISQRSGRPSDPGGNPRAAAVPLKDNHRTTKTDRSGRFIFENVAPDVYQLIAVHDSGGYVPAEYGQRSPNGEGIDVTLTAGQRLSGVQLAMAPTGSISGRVYDRDGEPLGRARVHALRAVYKNGRRTLTIVQIVESDDRGEYRLFWLAPGSYYISAKPDTVEGPGKSSPVSGLRITSPVRFGTYEQATNPIVTKRRLSTGEVVEETYVPVYYPGTIAIQSAAPVAVPAGSTVGGIDISVSSGLAPTRHIQGRLIDGATGQPVADASVTVIPRVAGPSLLVPTGLSTGGGFFDIGGVVPGSYVVAATHRSLSGTVNLDVGERNVTNVPIVMTSGFKISGRFLIDGRSRTGIDIPANSLRIASIVRDPELIGMPSGGPSFNPPVAPDGTFDLEGVPPGDFRLTVRGVPPDGYVKSMRMGNADVLNDGLHLSSPSESLLEIVIGANAGRIEGSVVNAQREPMPNRTVVLVPDVRLRHRQDLYKTVFTDVGGRFQMQGVPPGGYKLFAWEDVETGAWQNAEFIQLYEGRGDTVQISEGAALNVQITVIP